MSENEKLLSESKKPKTKKRRFNVLDLTLIVIVLLALLGVAFRGVIADLFVKGATEEIITVSFQTGNLNPSLQEHVKVDDIWLLDGEEFATLKTLTVDYGREVIETTDKKGNIGWELITDPKSVMMEGTIAVSGYYTENGFECLDALNLYVGKTFKITTSTYEITVIITEIPRK